MSFIGSRRAADGEQSKSKRFANGDSYTGSWQNQKPHGEGRYTWADGSTYDGYWRDGVRHGVGRFVWPSGAAYQGEWRDGYMHGTGTLDGPPCSEDPGGHAAALAALGYGGAGCSARYQGGWVRDSKHGLGKQLWSNGDVYEGLWRAGVPEGPGRYIFAEGSEYDGEWRDGLMAGHGTFVWASGERYEGQWKDGMQHGLGVLSLPDASLYDSQWQSGRRHGMCLYKPGDALSRRASLVQVASPGPGPAYAPPPSPGQPEAALHHDGNCRMQEGHHVTWAADPPDLRQHKLLRSFTRKPQQPPLPFPGAVAGGEGGGGSLALPAAIRVYDQGTIQQEWPLPQEEADYILTHMGQSRPESSFGWLLRKSSAGSGSPGPGGAGADKGKKKLGEAILKGHASYDLMLNLQLGIRYSISQMTAEACPKELAPQDYQLKVKQFFPQGGTEVTPVHSNEEFEWKDYCPMAFRKLRELYSLDAASYMLSLCSDAALRQLNSPGKSGSVFFLSHDDRFFVKTLRKGEVLLLYNMLPIYCKHMAHHPHSLLTRFFGLHRIKTVSKQVVYFVVMGNLFNTVVQLHKKFDLKGSRLGRTAGPSAAQDPHAICKDLDLHMTFKLEEGWLERLTDQLKADCSLLEACHIMDYSLLLGVNFRDRNGLMDEASVRMRPQNFAERSPTADYNSTFPRLAERVSKSKIPAEARSALLTLIRARLGGSRDAAAAARRSSVALYEPGVADPAVRHHRLGGASGATSAADQLALQLGQSHVQLGINMPALATTQGVKGMSGMAEGVVLYFGIIDILQDYNGAKRLEHRLKSLMHDSYSISVTDPKTYAQRFQSFLRSVFT
ncbi:PIP5K-domain-containing protein [Haematococcus lacustris]